MPATPNDNSAVVMGAKAQRAAHPIRSVLSDLDSVAVNRDEA